MIDAQVSVIHHAPHGDGGTIVATSRAAVIAVMAAGNDRQINLFERGRVEFHFKGPSVTMRILPVIDVDNDRLLKQLVKMPRNLLMRLLTHA